GVNSEDIPSENGDENLYLNEKSQELARSQKELADVPLFCFDAAEFVLARQEALRILGEKTEESLLLLTRCDLLTAERRADFENLLLTGTAPALRRRIVWTSSRTGAGIAELRARLTEMLSDRAGDESDVVAATQSRCRASLQLALESLERAEMLCGTEFQELIATELRVALEQIGFMVGAVYTEDLLDSIFSRFCVGK
ncbi:MAG: hypothetical protein Q4C70_12005, partial [Planctomycetia bacterium]|nr:hypothetical protein [Planctomycetia bacterium]